MLNFKIPSADAIADVRAKIDSLPAIVEALGKFQGLVRTMPPAPVVLGAVTRMIATTITAELRRRGPSQDFLGAAMAMNLTTDDAQRLFAAVIADIEAQ